MPAALRRRCGLFPPTLDRLAQSFSVTLYGFDAPPQVPMQSGAENVDTPLRAG